LETGTKRPFQENEEEVVGLLPPVGRLFGWGAVLTGNRCRNTYRAVKKMADSHINSLAEQIESTACAGS